MSSSSASNRAGFGGRAFLTGIIVAFGLGLLGSLALRPPGSAATAAAGSTEGGTQTARYRWRMPVSFASTMPVLGDNPIYVADQIRTSSSGGIDITRQEAG